MIVKYLLAGACSMVALSVFAVDASKVDKTIELKDGSNLYVFKDGKMGMSIRLGRVMAGVCLRSYHMPIDSQTRLEHILDGYRYAVNRATEIQKLLASE